MSKVTAVLEPQPDGTVHLPIPENLRHGAVKVQAEVEPAEKLLPAKSGLWKNMKGPFFIAPEFDDPLDDFREYMK